MSLRVVRSWGAATMAFVAAFPHLTGCRASSSAPVSPAVPIQSRAAVAAQEPDFVVTEPVAEQACAGIGLETCDNARDDNCNGLVDEGCGSAEAPVSLWVASEFPVSGLELRLSCPDGVLLSPQVEPTGTARAVDPVGARAISYRREELVPGTYTLVVRFAGALVEGPPAVRLELRLGSRRYSRRVQFFRASTVSLTFSTTSS